MFTRIYRPAARGVYSIFHHFFSALYIQNVAMHPTTPTKNMVIASMPYNPLTSIIPMPVIRQPNETNASTYKKLIANAFTINTMIFRISLAPFSKIISAHLYTTLCMVLNPCLKSKHQLTAKPWFTRRNDHFHHLSIVVRLNPVSLWHSIFVPFGLLACHKATSCPFDFRPCQDLFPFISSRT